MRSIESIDLNHSGSFWGAFKMISFKTPCACLVAQCWTPAKFPFVSWGFCFGTLQPAEKMGGIWKKTLFSLVTGFALSIVFSQETNIFHGEKPWFPVDFPRPPLMLGAACRKAKLAILSKRWLEGGVGGLVGISLGYGEVYNGNVYRIHWDHPYYPNFSSVYHLVMTNIAMGNHHF